MSSFAEFPQSAVGLPSSLKYDLPPSLPSEARAYSVSIAPNGVTEVLGTALPVAVFVSDSGMAQTPFTSQIIGFDIPAGQGSHVFLDPRETMLNFRLRWTVTTAAAGAADAAINLISSAASFFESLVLYQNNSPVEQVNSYNLLHNLLLNSTVNNAERYGGLSVGLGCDTNTQTGIDLPTTVGVYYFNFCIPLVSIIGLNTDKLIPIGSIQNLQLQMTTSNILPVSTYCSAYVAGAQPVITAPQLSQFSLNLKYVDIGAGAAGLLSQTLQDGKWFIKSFSYTNSNATIPLGSSGSSSVLYQIRNSSVKSLFITNTITTVGATTPNGYYDAINMGISSLNASIGGLKFPNRPLSPDSRPAECFMEYMAAWGARSLKSYGGVISRDSYGATMPALPANCDKMLTLPAEGLRGVDPIVKSPHMHYLGFDLEKVQGSLFSGLNTRSSPPYVDMTLSQASTATVQSYAWGLSDVILVIDTTTKTLQSFI